MTKEYDYSWIADLFTKKELKDVLALDNGRLIEEKYIISKMPYIDAQTGQENSPRFIAYSLLNEARKLKDTL